MDRIDEEEAQALARRWLTTERANVASATSTRRLASLRSFAKWAGWGSFLTDYIAPPADRADPHPLPGGHDDVFKMLDHCENPLDRALVTLCSMVGCRVSEARSITTDSFDLEQMRLSIRGKGNKQRFVPIGARAWELMFPAYRWAMQNDAPLVPYSDATARNKIRAIGKRAGISRAVSSHDLRATFATAMYGKTLDIRLVQEALGHSSSKTTEVYTKVNMDNMREAVEF